MSFYWEFNGFWGPLILRHTMILEPSKTSPKVELAPQRKVLLKNTSGKNDVLLSIPTDAVFLNMARLLNIKKGYVGSPMNPTILNIGSLWPHPTQQKPDVRLLVFRQQCLQNDQLSKD